LLSVTENDLYSHQSIVLNGKELDLGDILSNNVFTQTEFERNTVTFLREWLTGKEKFIVHTSGSTGEPKSIAITRGQMAGSALMTIEALRLKKNDTALLCLNTQFIAGKMMLVRALVGNMHIIATEPSSNPLEKIVRPFDFIALVPLQVQKILSTENRKSIDYIKDIIIGGAAIDQTQLKIIKDIKSPVFATYGMTETISHIALQRLDKQSAEHYYKTLPGIKIDVDDRGCLVIHAPYLTQEIKTNDLVKLHNHQAFSWLGRWDNVINTGGIKVSPEKVEREIQQIMETFNIQQNFIVSSTPDATLGEKVILITEGPPQEKWGKILTLYKQSFSRYEVPKEIYTLHKFIYTKSEKIDRKATQKATMA
jgi:o-succinylbenzoate---CoA ligase